MLGRGMSVQSRHISLVSRRNKGPVSLIYLNDR
jgi:hypothetical protein